ncbi:alpha/beta hydrolase [Massilia consociata]|uniref:Alpha/beta hydrolase n=1 Tax=Massilia consociata TaxID=760117 RepID=A0ABV6FEG4_9BURK
MAADAHLAARPAPVSAACTNGPTGLHKLDVGGARDSYVFVPSRYDPAVPTPLVLLLHGAGGHAHDGLRVLLHLADHAGLILVAPASHRHTWDIIAGRSYGPDRDLADRALAEVFARYHVDPARLGIGGFSDGASYALSLGLANGDLFTHVLAFSPGFVGPMSPRGKPSVFISHGTGDHILPIDACSRRIVRALRAAGYPLRYEEFEGEHVIPPDIAQAALVWFSPA